MYLAECNVGCVGFVVQDLLNGFVEFSGRVPPKLLHDVRQHRHRPEATVCNMDMASKRLSATTKPSIQAGVDGKLKRGIKADEGLFPDQPAAKQ